MPKILERGKKYKKAARYRDTTCGSLVEYYESDISSDRDGQYVICPVCKQYISTAILKWSTVEED